MLIYPASSAIAQLQGKWRVHILSTMRNSPVRLGQLSRLLPDASKKVLMTELKQLVSSGLVERRDLSNGGGVRHVEYSLVESIKSATCLLLEQLEFWAQVRESANAGMSKNDNSCEWKPILGDFCADVTREGLPGEVRATRRGRRHHTEATPPSDARDNHSTAS